MLFSAGAVTGCAGIGHSGRQGPLPSRLKYAYNQCKDGGGRECFERILGPADHVGPTASGKLYMRWIASPRTRTADNVYQRNESASGPCKLEINLDDNKMVKWLFTGICRDEILNKDAAWTRETPQGPPCQRLNFRQRRLDIHNKYTLLPLLLVYIATPLVLLDIPPAPNALRGGGCFWYAINHTNQNVKQDLLATVGPGTIIVRDAPDTDLSGLNRNQEKTETIFNSSFAGHSKAGNVRL